MNYIPPHRNLNLASHRSYLSNPVKIDHTEIQVGDVVKFIYKGKERTVFVLNANWRMQLHGLSMDSINRRDLMVEVVAKSDLYRSPIDFYTRVISQRVIQDIDAYRTYEINQIKNLRRMTYQIDERGREEL